MTIQKKLMIISVGSIVPLIITAAVSLAAFQELDPRKSASVSTVTALANNMDADMTHDALRADVQDAMNATSAAEAEAVNSHVSEHAVNIKEMFAKNSKLRLSPVTHAEIESLIPEVETYGKLAAEVAAVAQTDRQQAADRRRAFDQKFFQLEDRLGKLHGLLSTEAVEAQNREAANLATSKTALLITGFSSALLLVVAGILVSKSIGKHLLTDIRRLSEASLEMKHASGEIAGASQEVSQGASAQAATLEQISSSAEQISAMAQSNLESSRSAAKSVNDSQQRFTQANGSLAEMVESMEQISAQSNKISRIIKLIDEIAFQTNILALNAAVEAARAGDAGMGFAVVADEVRSLAQRSAQAARDTAVLVEESLTRSHTGQEKVSHLKEGIRQITADAALTRVMVERVTAGSEEQTLGIKQISQAIGHMQNVTQSTAASAQNGAEAGRQLNEQCTALNEVAGNLCSLVGAAEEA